MGDEIVFSTASKCFAPVGEGEWRALTSGAAWSDFVDAARRLLQRSASIGADRMPIEQAHVAPPLQEYLSAGEVDALFTPPSWRSKQEFAARHFVGGLPESAPPVESLYRLPDGSADASPAAAGGLCGAYGGESARYMRDLIARMGLSLPPAFSDRPDHLSIELDLLALMLQNGMTNQALCFLRERFSWLPAFRMRLLRLDADVAFYVGMVDVVLGVWLLHGPNGSAGRPAAAA